MSLEGSFPEGPMLVGPKTDESWGVAGCGAERPFVPQGIIIGCRGLGQGNRRCKPQVVCPKRALRNEAWDLAISKSLE